MIIFFIVLIFYIILLITSLTILFIKHKNKTYKLKYDFLDQKKECNLHTWINSEEIGGYVCKECNFIAGSYITSDEIE